MRMCLEFFSIIVTSVIFLVFNLHGLNEVGLAWNFSELGLPQNVLIWRFTIWRNRAFLAVPRWEKKAVKIPFTLLEASWPETGIPLQFGVTLPEVVPFPDAASQEEGNCQHLQSVTGLDSDSRGRLWILDSPTRSFHCRIAKIIVFDLRRNEKTIETELQGVSPRGLKCLVVDPVVSLKGYHQAYVSDPGDETIIVYNLAQKSWWKVKLTREFNYHSQKIFSTDLAIARKSSVMYLTGYPSHDLFSIDLETIRNEEGSLGSSKNVHIVDSSIIKKSTPITFVGSKMGSSSGLICDFRAGLHYFMVTEIASVRWDTRHKLEAEEHSVLIQSEIVPCITDYALDSQKNVWAIVNDRHPLRNLTDNNILGAVGSKNNKIKRRTIKIYKHNPFVL